MKKIHTLIFGANGYIGSKICDHFIAKKENVISVIRNELSLKSLPENIKNNSEVLIWDLLNDDNLPSQLRDRAFDSVIWVQGQNCNDSVYDFDIEKNIELYKSNCLYVIKSLNLLIDNNLLANSSKLCIISSIWQNLARQNKLSYCVTKSALQGLVNSLAADIAKDGHLVNAILPGAIEAPMTYQNLSKDQIKLIKESTNFNRLSNAEDIANLAYFLCSEGNTSITGQFINIDLGFSNVRII